MSNVILLRGGGRKIPKNFDRNFHRIMQQSFPDVPARVDYENTQRKLYNSAIRKLRMASSWDLNPDPKKILSEAEQNAMDYFNGTGFYKEQQSLRTPPNKFDTRESFLFKMHDPIMRKKFLENRARSNSKFDTENH